MIKSSSFPGSQDPVRSSQKEPFKYVNGVNPSDYANTGDRSQSSQKLSTEQILKLARERFVRFSSQKFININMLEHSCGSSLSDLSMEDKQDVELAQLLLAAAEMVAHQQFERAVKLLSSCQWAASSVGTPVQRAVFYFTEALMERINKETARSSESNGTYADACANKNILAFLAMYQELPFFQVVYFTAVQTILENIRMKSKVHLIDFQILTGVCRAALMQALTEQRTDQSGYLKITTIETQDKCGSENTGKLLTSFARYLNLPFSYKVVFLSDIKDLKEEELGIEPEEAVAVLFPFILRNLILKPTCLKNLMTIAQRIKPSIVVVGEAEANHNSPSFVNCFIEALFFYGALFDSLEESMACNNKDRRKLK